MAPVEMWGVGEPILTFGYGGDLHWSDKAESINRFYRDADEKLADAVDAWNRIGVDFAIMCGDYIDHDGQSKAQAETDLALAEAVYDNLTMDRYYVLGNHEMDQFTKAEFIAATAMTDAHYSFDVGGVHVVALDDCYEADDDDSGYAAGDFDHSNAYINPAQRTWLTSDLSGTSSPVLVFIHRPLNPGNTVADHRVDNASAVRSILEASGKVVAVFSGHSHTNERQKYGGIRYFGMDALTEDAYPAAPFAVVRLYENNYISVRGYGGQDSYAGMLPLW